MLLLSKGAHVQRDKIIYVQYFIKIVTKRAFLQAT